jgi:hypothetical protein
VSSNSGRVLTRCGKMTENGLMYIRQGDGGNVFDGGEQRVATMERC